MEERGNKTIICSVFFLDIIEYSKKSVADQISLKERFNAFLATAIRDVPINDRIILDTGDGAAVSFLGEIEDALRAALSMRSSLLSDEGLKQPSLQVRMGVNLGPVRLVRDINGLPNLVGDGINVAQRIMGFASTGQILVSRSYYDAASRLSHDYKGMFHYEGSRTDKHVREHEVYAIGYPGDFTSTQRRFHLKSESKLYRIIAKTRRYWEPLHTWHNKIAIHLRDVFEHSSSNKKALYIGLITLPVLLIVLLVIRLAYFEDESSKAMPKEVEVTALPKEVAHSAVPVASPVLASTSAVITPAPASEAEESKPGEQSETAKQEKQESVKSESQHFKVVESSIAVRANVSLSIKPWGEVYVDGKMVGVSPPLTKLQLSPGEHVIEVRNTTFPVNARLITINPGEKVSVKHKFGN